MSEDEANKPSSTFMNVRPVWKADEEATHCFKCETKFNLIKRKHHCRNCGEVFCGSCSSHNIAIPKLNYRYDVRVCTDCYSLLNRPY